MPTTSDKYSQHGFVSLRPATAQLGIHELLVSAARRLLTFPVATAIGFLATAAFCFIIDRVAILLNIGWGTKIVLIGLVSCALLLCLLALAVIREDSDNHIRYLFRVGAAITVIAGFAMGLLALLVVYVVPVQYFEFFQHYWVAKWAVFVLLPLGSAAFAAGTPNVLLAWMIVARHETHFGDTLQFVLSNVESSLYRWMSFIVGISLSCALISCLPVVGLLIPIFLTQFYSVILTESIVESENKQ